MQKYKTRQRRVLLDYLAAHADEELSARQIETALREFDISLSAVYRNLSALESEGKVRRVSKSGSREVYYQYTDCMSCKDCLHLSCEKCGKTYHMNIPGMEMLIENLASSDEFAIDRKNTVLYGVCKSCQKEDKEKVS